MHFFDIRCNEVFKKYKDICNKVSNTIKIEFDSEPIYNEEFLKTKIKSSGDEVTNWHFLLIKNEPYLERASW